MPNSTWCQRLFGSNVDFSKRVFGLDLLRAIAIILVLVGHSRKLLAKTGFDFSFILPAGLIGVELFFVLSGYLIGSLLLRGLSSQEKPSARFFFHFWIRRIFRTLPNYYLVLLFNLGLMYWIHGKPMGMSFRYLFFLQNFASKHPPAFPEAWTLAVEEWFYILLPVLLYIAIRCTGEIKRGAASTILFLLVAPALLRYWIAFGPEVHWAWHIRKVVLLRLDAVMYGVGAAYLQHYYPRLTDRLAYPLFFLGLVLLMMATFFFFADIRPPWSTYFARTTFFSFLNLSCACVLPAAARFHLKRKWIVGLVTHISVTSYSLYLLHLISINVIRHKLQPDTVFAAVLAYVAFWILTYAWATLQYNLYERPFTALREKFAARQATVAVAPLGAGVTA